MGKDILTKVRKLNWMLQESGSGVFSFNDFCGILSDLMDANVYITNKRGKVIGVHYKIKSDSPTITDPETGIEKFPNEYNDALLRVVETEANLRAEEALEIFKYDYDTYDKLHTIIPIISEAKKTIVYNVIIVFPYSALAAISSFRSSSLTETNSATGIFKIKSLNILISEITIIAHPVINPAAYTKYVGKCVATHLSCKFWITKPQLPRTRITISHTVQICTSV